MPIVIIYEGNKPPLIVNYVEGMYLEDFIAEPQEDAEDEPFNFTTSPII